MKSSREVLKMASDLGEEGTAIVLGKWSIIIEKLHILTYS